MAKKQAPEITCEFDIVANIPGGYVIRDGREQGLKDLPTTWAQFASIIVREDPGLLANMKGETLTSAGDKITGLHYSVKTTEQDQDRVMFGLRDVAQANKAYLRNLTFKP